MEELFINDASNVCRTLFNMLARKAHEAESAGHGNWLDIVRSRLTEVKTWTDHQWKVCVVQPMIDMSAAGIEAEDKQEAASMACKDAFKLWAMVTAKNMSATNLHSVSAQKFLELLVTRVAQDADVTTGKFFDMGRAEQNSLIETCAKETLLRHCLTPVTAPETPALFPVAPVPTAFMGGSGGGSGVNLLNKLDDLPHDSVSTAPHENPVVFAGPPAAAAVAAVAASAVDGESKTDDSSSEDDHEGIPTPSIAAMSLPGGQNTVLCDDVRNAKAESTIIMLNAADMGSFS